MPHSALDTSTPAGLRAARHRLGWSGRRAAAELGTTQTTISHWETGRHRICPRAAQALVWRLELEGERRAHLATYQRAESLDVELEAALELNAVLRLERLDADREAARLRQQLRDTQAQRDELRARHAVYDRLIAELNGTWPASERPSRAKPRRVYSPAAQEAARVLGVELGERTTERDVKHAYWRASQLTHPDRNDGEGGEAFMRVTSARDTLLSELRRWA